MQGYGHDNKDDTLYAKATRYQSPVLLPEATAVHGEAARSQPLREHPLHGTRPHRLARMHAAGIDTATGIGVVPQERVAY